MVQSERVICLGHETVYIVSDSVGETAEYVVRAVSTQFSNEFVEIKRFSHVEDIADLEEIIKSAKEKNSIIAYTIVISSLKTYLDCRSAEEDVMAVDLLSPLMNAFEQKYQTVPNHQPKLMRKLDDDYFNRIAAIEFAVKYDDGRDPSGLIRADIVLIGVSRTSKTPLSMYLAHQRYKVANVPLVPEVPPPAELFKLPRNKCIGLMINPDQLNGIRKERLKSLGLSSDINYASYERILKELDHAESIMKRVGCPIIDVTNKAVEETASLIIDLLNKERS